MLQLTRIQTLYLEQTHLQLTTPFGPLLNHPIAIDFFPHNLLPDRVNNKLQSVPKSKENRLLYFNKMLCIKSSELSLAVYEPHKDNTVIML